MPDWLFALLIALGAVALGALLGAVLFLVSFAPLYRRKDRA